MLGERAEQVVHRGEAVARIDRERAHHDAPHPARHLALGRDVADLPGHRRGRDLEDRLTEERSLAVEALVQRDPEGELIGARIGGSPRCSSGAMKPGVPATRPACVSIDRCAAADRHRLAAGRRAAVGRGIVREAEVHHAHATVVADHHVLGLEVAVDQALGVRGRQPAPRGEEQLEHLGPGRSRRETLLERRALDELHRDVDEPLVLADVVHRDHVRVGEAGHRHGLAQQTTRLATLAAGAGVHDLQRDLAIELWIVGPEHDTHAARAQAGDHDVAPDATARLDRRRVDPSGRAIAQVRLGLGMRRAHDRPR